MGTLPLSSSRHFTLVTTLTVSLLAGCASTRGGGHTLNEVVIVNQARSSLADVSVASTDSGRLFECGNVAPRGICSNRFAPIEYGAGPVEVTWSMAGSRTRSETIRVAVPAHFDAGIPLRGVLVIDDRGDIEAYLQQAAPGPHL